MFKKSFLLISAYLLFHLSNAQNVSQGLKYMDMEQYGNARKTFVSLASANPQNAEFQYYLGDFYIKYAFIDTTANEGLDSAKVCFTKGLSLDPKNPLNYVGLGTLKYLNREWDSSKVYFDQALKLSKQKNALVFFKIGEAYLYKGAKDVNIAIPQLEKAQSLDPKNTDIIIALGDAYLIADKGSATRAIKQYSMALDKNPKLAKAFIKKGKIYLMVKNYEEALKYYNEGIEADPSYSPAYRERAELYFKLKGYREKAPSEYKKYLSMSDGNYKSKFRFAYFCFTVGDYDDAVAQLNELYKINPQDRILYRLSAYCDYEEGAITTDSVAAKKYFKDGLTDIQKFFKMTTDTNKLIASDYEYYGKLLLKNGKDAEGIKYLFKATQKDSTKYEVYGDLGKYYNDKKKYALAGDMYSKYYSYKTPGANDLLNWGRAYYNAEQFERADSVFSILVTTRPEEILGYKWRALANARDDKDAKTGKGVPFYEKFIEMAQQKDANKYKNDIIAGYTYLGKYYLHAKNINKSKQYWKKILELDPNDANAKMVLGSIK